MKNDSQNYVEPQVNRRSHAPPAFKKQISENFKSSKIEASDSFSSLNEAMIKIETNNTGRSTENETGLNGLEFLEDVGDGANNKRDRFDSTIRSGSMI